MGRAHEVRAASMAKTAAICELETRKEDLKKQIKEYIDSF